ncbi:hypothetical protein POM88_052890 [Heracleum sosnowskyi]|uniref:Uncharacterized protein n=1 Tax=Heracleum sosnowskyi TaxID=360622 RepID=A0AAD8GRH4_9APIA|nr:hypothetical protein POM88_052890 [Heracleum sosnowskyi]
MHDCSSGLQAVADVAVAIKSGLYEIGIGDGLESMTVDQLGRTRYFNPKLGDLKYDQGKGTPTNTKNNWGGRKTFLLLYYMQHSKCPLAEIAKLKSTVGLLETKYAIGLANIPEVDVEAVDGPLN